MLDARATLWKVYLRLHELVAKLVAGYELCRRLMQIPGVGPVAALSLGSPLVHPAGLETSPRRAPRRCQRL